MEKFCKCLPLNCGGELKFVVVLSFYQGKLLLSRHMDRATWETQGGHIEPGETPLQAARRELYEESGAAEFTIVPLCDYLAGDGLGSAYGQVFRADITRLGPLPPSEMAEVALFDDLPENITYPHITPVLFQQMLEKQSPIKDD